MEVGTVLGRATGAALFQVPIRYSTGGLCTMVRVDGPHRPCIRKSLDFSPIVHRVRDLWASNLADRLLAGGEEQLGFLLLGLSVRSISLHRPGILMESHSEWSKFGYLLVHLALVGISLLLKRKVFVVFGAVGILGYLTNETYTHFRNSVAFPFVLSAIGIALIFLAMQYKRNETALQERATWLGRRAGTGSGRA